MQLTHFTVHKSQGNKKGESWFLPEAYGNRIFGRRAQGSTLQKKASQVILLQVVLGTTYLKNTVKGKTRCNTHGSEFGYFGG